MFDDFMELALNPQTCLSEWPNIQYHELKVPLFELCNVNAEDPVINSGDNPFTLQHLQITSY